MDQVTLPVSALRVGAEAGEAESAALLAGAVVASVWI